MHEKSCLKCGRRFKKRKINGIVRRIDQRKYCWECSPFTRTTNWKLSRSNKYCPKCDKTKVVEEFYARSGRKQLYAYCRSCMIAYQQKRNRDLKQRAVDYKGGKCERCGYSRCIWALDFHHPESSKKDINIAHASYRWAKLQSELDKCMLVCSNCHREIHAIERGQYVEPSSTENA